MLSTQFTYSVHLNQTKLFVREEMKYMVYLFVYLFMPLYVGRIYKNVNISIYLSTTFVFVSYEHLQNA